MTKEEIDMTIETLIEAKKAGQFRAFWTDFNESVNLMASGEVVIQSMWSPAVTAVRSKGIACTFQPLKEGYRAWASGFGLPKTLEGQEARRRLRVHQLVPLRLGRRLSEPPGLLRAVLETAKANMEPYEWAYWMEGKPAEKDIHGARRRRCSRRPARCATAAPTTTRMGAIACWNSVMDENAYMVQKWNEFIAA